jgi:hypothetical protein
VTVTVTVTRFVVQRELVDSGRCRCCWLFFFRIKLLACSKKQGVGGHRMTRVQLLRQWVKEGVGLVVHFSLEDVAKINTP